MGRKGRLDGIFKVVMRRKPQLLVVSLIIVLAAAGWSLGGNNKDGSTFIGQDLHLAGRELISYQQILRPGSGQGADGSSVHILVFPDGFSMSLGSRRAGSLGVNQFISDKAVVWLESSGANYKAWVYLQGNVLVKTNGTARAVDLNQVVIKQGQEVVLRFDFSGEVFATAQIRKMADPRGLELYAKAFAAISSVTSDMPLSELSLEKIKTEKPSAEAVSIKPQEKKSAIVYPIYFAPAGEVAPVVEWDNQAKFGTIIGRFYIWQKQAETGRLLELQADNAVIFCSEQTSEKSDQISGLEDILAAGTVQAIYLSGDVVMAEGHRTIRADEIYYNFAQKKALAINAVARSFDASRGIPIYVRAAKLKQVAENKFAAEDITLTTSEFYLPQISLSASDVIITDTTYIDEQADKVSDRSFDAQMRDVRLKMYDKTIFYLPSMRSNLQRPDVPIKGVHVGNDSTWGTSVETQWYLARLLGLQESEGTDSTITLDYYSKRGLGSGLEVNYAKEDYFGRILGYIIDDHGEDRLGRLSSRKDLEPPQEIRGRFRWQHKQFLPYNWQLATEISYASDKNFIEQYYRSEFNTDKEQETVVHLKRIERNFGLAFLGKARLNDFANEVEELPTAEFHWTGESFLSDRLTFYSDSQASRFSQRSGTALPSDGTTFLHGIFTYTATRNEIDMPLMMGRSKVVPFAAGTLGYEDGDGFRTKIDGTMTDEDTGVWLGEAGVRASTMPFWNVYPDVNSRLWDLKGLRHIIQPQLTAVAYIPSDPVVEQRDTLNLDLSQRLQTKRGTGDRERTVDWMRLDSEVTLVSNSSDTSAGPDRFIWNKPFIPLVNRYSSRFGDVVLPPQDRRSSDIYGPRRNYYSTDYIWRIGDTTALLSDMYFDMQSRVVQQFNVGMSVMRWPNLSYYIGSRYLRRVENGYEKKDSNAFIFAATYILDPRYTLVFSQQYDFGYGVNINNDITLIRRYHRVCFALMYSVDESLDQQSFIFSLWPEGVQELVFGSRRYMKLADSAGY